MKKFPITIVDNFYENPDLVRDYALSLDYNSSIDGRWPGTRTEHLGLINRNFFQTFTNKLFSLFFDFEKTDLDWQVETSFQKISPFGKNRDNILNDGWIHHDSYHFSGIIYLNPDDSLYSGTNIYRLKSGESADCPQKTKFLHYSGSKNFDEKEYELEKQYNNDKFEETVVIKNVYNRLVLFEGGVYHGVPTYYTESGESRLTQVFFVNELISSSMFPIVRSKLSNDH